MCTASIYIDLNLHHFQGHPSKLPTCEPPSFDTCIRNTHPPLRVRNKCFEQKGSKLADDTTRSVFVLLFFCFLFLCFLFFCYLGQTLHSKTVLRRYYLLCLQPFRKIICFPAVYFFSITHFLSSPVHHIISYCMYVEMMHDIKIIRTTIS